MPNGMLPTIFEVFSGIFSFDTLGSSPTTAFENRRKISTLKFLKYTGGGEVLAEIN